MIGQLQCQHVPGHDAREVDDPQAVEHTLEIGIEGLVLHLHLLVCNVPRCGRFTSAPCTAKDTMSVLVSRGYHVFFQIDDHARSGA